ncbi:MAG: type II toxin-antitoxin system death-on-curing family toxin [Caldilineaceae bacterium]|nr:type II toxin-antitoxin system death-on-curing family toxin [Caldilineaceae bacterium]
MSSLMVVEVEIGGQPGLGYYESLIEEAAALLESLANNDPFVDGKKRTALAVTDTFLHLNGYYIDCDSRETCELSMRLPETHTFRSARLRTWLKENARPLPAI